MKELEKDMNQLRGGLKEVGREVEFYRSQPVSTGDRYLPVMKEFMTVASVRLAELEDLFTDMKARVSHLANLTVTELGTFDIFEFFSIIQKNFFVHFLTCNG